MISTYFLGSNNVGVDLSTLRCLVPNSRLFASRAAAETKERKNRNNSTRIRQNQIELKKEEIDHPSEYPTMHLGCSLFILVPITFNSLFCLEHNVSIE
jgi:hypothetical protein